MVLTPPGTPSSFTWIIAGEKGALTFEGNNINIQIMPPKLFWYRSEPDTDGRPEWQEVTVEEPLAFGQVGELYQALADEEKVPGILTDFERAALRHSMLDACAKSAQDGTRESYL
jgi:predicted dehydrogenase